MPAVEALMVAVSGFLVVFLMLILLWAIIELVNRIVTSAEKVATKPVETVPVKTPVKEEVITETKKPHEIYGGEIALYDVDEKTAACIMAIVSDSTKIPLDQLIFRSIRALD